MEKEPLERKLTAILYADVAGYSRLTGEDEEGTHRTLSAYLDAITHSIERHNGKVLHYAGDAVLAEFASVVHALTCATNIQADVKKRNENLAEERKLQFRIGVNLGDVIVDRNEIYGDGVNIAARLESLAEPGGICISRPVFDQVRNKLEVGYEFLGEQSVKNIAAPVEVYKVRLEPEAAGTVIGKRLGAGPWRRSALVAGVVLLVGVAVAVWMRPGAPPAEAPSLPDKPSIAVLPFDNLSGDPEQDYFSDGMTDDLITDLSKVSGLFVIARNSVFTYKDRAVKVRQVAKELGVRYVLEGSVRRAGDQVRINAQLIDATTGGHLWAERYDGSITDVFALQDKVTAKIVSALAVNLTATEKTQVARMPTQNLEAYDYYLRGNSDFWVWSSQGRRDALSLYQKAITLDPTFADAYAGIADAAAAAWRWGEDDVLPAPVARKRAYEAASRALALDPHNAKAYSVLGLLQMADSRHDEAIASAQKSISLDPNNADAYTYLATVLTFAGRHAEALAAMETAFRLNPKPPAHFYGDLGWVLFHNRQYEKAIGPLEKALEAGVELFGTLAMTYAQLGRLDEARAMVDKILESFPAANLAYHRVLYAHHKRKEDLEHRIDSLRKAGMPEWPFGYKGRPEDRLDERAITALIFGRTWIGQDPDGGPFIQETSQDGSVAFRSPVSLLTGTAWVEGGMLCYQFSAVALSRKSCGYVFRNPVGTPDEQNEYVQVGVADVLYFSVKP